ncbi:SAG-related sequence [Besnoitia besnoiti]|uniref:SAG-related sequence n=1 Tax=Besnoitia besnoiti TaxID=94643 RepID=A0A2A9MJD1_BESBE|nr:SAG-related sequence [Besnoitia besnoiti]PFH36076.1 SAG-related sequence [Besnoitia besnoiti]
MAAVSTMTGPFPHVTLVTVERQMRREVQYSSRRRSTTMLSSVSLCMLLFYSSLSMGAMAAAPTVSAQCVPGEPQTTCTCEGTSGRAVTDSASVILSQNQNELEMVCAKDLQCAPKELSGKVCEANDEALTECSVELSTLFAGKSSEISWTKPKKRNGLQGESKILTVPPENFPFVDERFAVGCMDESTKKCKVTVTVEARPSVTQGQTVTCAYGAGSNDLRQAVKLSPTQNSFTLVCGDKGEVLPKNYNEAFCSSGLTGNEETCKGSYTSILPGYEANWWNKDDTKHSVTLSIPTDQFPAEEAKIVVGCQKTASSSKRTPVAVLRPTVCNVDVTIEASSPAALSSMLTSVPSLVAGATMVTAFSQRV